jgi:flagellar biogenesis protein FliO
MYDSVRWAILGILFVGLFGLWLWSRRQAARNQGPLGSHPGSSFKVLQKRWIDQRTGICLVEAEDQTFLLAYSAGGVSWQVLDKKASNGPKTTSTDMIKAINRLNSPMDLPGNGS